MSERDSQQEQQGSPLKTERGTTTIQDTVVARVVGRAAREVEGVQMGGGVARKAGGLFQRASDSEPETQGVSVEVGSEEAAVDLKMAIEHGNNLLEATRTVRDRINERVGDWIGLKVTEINITIENILVPDKDERRDEDDDSGEENGFQRDEEPQAQQEQQQTEQLPAATTEDAGDADEHEPIVETSATEPPVGEETVGDDTREIRTGAASEGEKTQPLDQESDDDDEEVHVEGVPLERGEEADLNVGQDDIEKRPVGRESHSSDEESSPEEEGISERERRRRRRRNRD